MGVVVAVADVVVVNVASVVVAAACLQVLCCLPRCSVVSPRTIQHQIHPQIHPQIRVLYNMGLKTA